jgi:hypothetical protein
MKFPTFINIQFIYLLNQNKKYLPRTDASRTTVAILATVADPVAATTAMDLSDPIPYTEPPHLYRLLARDSSGIARDSSGFIRDSSGPTSADLLDGIATDHSTDSSRVFIQTVDLKSAQTADLYHTADQASRHVKGTPSTTCQDQVEQLHAVQERLQPANQA